MLEGNVGGELGHVDLHNEEAVSITCIEVSASVHIRVLLHGWHIPSH